MSTVGVIAEYDPFHTGHAWHLAETRRLLGADTAVVCVMSGNWTQRGTCALTDKWTRASLALSGGADLVLELPTVWAVSSAESFARGAAGLLEAAGVVDVLSFGSECGDADKLRLLAACLDSPACQAELSRFPDRGMPFAACRQEVVRRLLGEELAALLSSPNNNLGAEYIRALSALKSPIRPMTIPRRGAGHNAPGARDGFASATHIRALLRAGDWATAEGLLPPGSAEVLRQAPLADLGRCERAVLARLRTMTAGDWAALPDAGAAEGLPDRLVRAARQAGSLNEFYEAAKTRRYAHARLRRLVLWAFLGLTGADRPASPPYLRVLGFNGRGREVLREMKEKSVLPILTKPAHARSLPEEGRRLFELEAQCTDLYALTLPHPERCGREWRESPVFRP